MQNREEARKVVGPGAEAGESIRVEGVRHEFRLLEESPIVGHEHPGSGVLAARFVYQAVDVPGLHARSCGYQCDGRLEVYVPIRYMESDDSPRCKMTPIEIKSLGRQQMKRDSIARERINYQDIKALRRLV